MPFSPLLLILFIFLLGWLIAFIQLGILTIAFQKLGLSPGAAFLLLFGSLLGSAVNIPLVKVKASQVLPPEEHPLVSLLRPRFDRFQGYTIIAVNVGGCIIPLLFSLYLVGRDPSILLPALLGMAVVTAISYRMSQPVPGMGIAMPILIAPATAALVALLLDGDNSPAIAYVSGTLGVLIGADLLHLREVRTLGAPVASIGGAGTFDGIFLTGVVAVLLA